MKQKAIPMVSGVAVALLAALTLWQITVVALLVRSMAAVLTGLGHLF